MERSEFSLNGTKLLNKKFWNSKNKNFVTTGQFEKRLKIHNLRTPWVPAPAKSSSASVITPYRDTVDVKERRAEYSSSSTEGAAKYKSRLQFRENTGMSSINHEDFTKGVRPSTSTNAQTLSRTTTSLSQRQRHDSYQRHVRRPLSHSKKVKHGHRQRATQYKLQSKDSLVDVTACLQEKRGEVMKLWEKSIMKGDAGLLTKIEKANCLALEAAEEVETLRRTIQDLQRKEDGLSDSDCLHLEQMRVKVLEKVKMFDEADNLLHETIAKQSTSKVSLVNAASKTSQTDNNYSNLVEPRKSESATFPSHYLPPAINHQTIAKKSHSSDEVIGNLKNIIVLKEKHTNISEESECENGQFKGNETRSHVQMQSDLSEQVAGVTAKTLLENFDRLNTFYEGVTLPQLQEFFNFSNESFNVDKGYNITTHSKPEPEQGCSTTSNHHHPKQHSNHVQFTDDGGNKGNESGESFSKNTITDDLNRERISGLQRKLMETEQEVEELKSEIERIESDANFRVRILQNSLQDKFESLQVIPDYLQLIDQKYHETVEDKMKLQHTLDSKDILINEIKEQNKHLKVEGEELREHLRKAENCKDFISFKNVELEKSNTGLRKQVEELTCQIAEMSCQIKILKKSESTTVVTSHSRQNPWVENQHLKMQCADLKEQIAQSKRTIQSLRKSKAKLVSSLNERVEELMDVLQQTQHHKRVLGDQIRYLKKSYHELFPPDVFSTMPMSSSKKSPWSCMKNKNMKSSEAVAEEPRCQSKVAWQTGSGIV